MTVRQPRYSKEEFARLGDEIHERDIPRSQPLAGNAYEAQPQVICVQK